MRLIDRLLTSPPEPERLSTLDDLDDWFQFNGWNYPILGRSSGGETLEHSFDGYISAALKANPVVFACVAARMMLFSEARFAWRDVSNGNIFGTTDLGPLEAPGTNRTTQELLALCELDATFAGNSYWVRDGSGVRRLRPDWVGIVVGDPKKGQRSTDLLGYTYVDGGPGHDTDVELFTPAEVAHFSPTPDPSAQHRGMSWLTPVIVDIQADTAFTKHRRSVAKQGGIHSFAVQYPPLGEDQFKEAVKSFREMYEGTENSGKSIHVGGGADITPLTMDLRQLDFKAVQGGGETRIAAAARVPAVIAGISEGLSGSSLNQGNYGMARRQFGDLFARPSWRSVCGAFANLVTPPAGSNVLWWDESDIGFLREDQKDAAEVIGRKAEALRSLVDSGFTPDSAAAVVGMPDLEHSGLASVQLQPIGQSINAGGDQPSGTPALTEGDPE